MALICEEFWSTILTPSLPLADRVMSADMIGAVNG
jgi:hypothetical protein